jgi:N-acetylmuramoyl-L-alanine amidase
LANNDKRLKGLQPVEYYVENGTYKYTYGTSTDYNTVRSKLKTVTAKFKDAFIIAFKNDKKVNVNEAINEFLQNKK